MENFLYFFNFFIFLVFLIFLQSVTSYKIPITPENSESSVN